MARINVEDSLFADPRFHALVRIIGKEDEAAGLMLRFWRAAQKFWGDGRKLVPLELFELGEFEPIVKVGLAKKQAYGVYACGSEDRFGWYLQKCEASKCAAKKRQANHRNHESGPPEPLTRSTELRDTVHPPTPTPTLALDRELVSTTSFPPESDPRPPKNYTEDFKPQDLVKIWNDHCGGLPKTIKLSPKRLNHSRVRIKESPDKGYWVGVVKKISSSAFCNGDSNTSWRATYDWLIQPDTHIKVMEGKYDNFESASKDGYGFDVEEMTKRLEAMQN